MRKSKFVEVANESLAINSLVFQDEPCKGAVTLGCPDQGKGVVFDLL